MRLGGLDSTHITMVLGLGLGLDDPIFTYKIGRIRGS